MVISYICYSKAVMPGSSPTDSETHLMLWTCYNTLMSDRCKDVQLVQSINQSINQSIIMYKIANDNVSITKQDRLEPPLRQS